MNKPQHKPYFYGMLAGFGAISLSVVFFFILYRAQSIGAVVDKITNILMPFVYGGVIAYLLCPMCNMYSDFFGQILPCKLKKWAEPIALTLSMLTGALISGKICTTILFVSLILMVLMPQMNANVVTVIIIIDAVFMLISFAHYALTYYKKTPMIQNIEDHEDRKR